MRLSAREAPGPPRSLGASLVRRRAPRLHPGLTAPRASAARLLCGPCCSPTQKLPQFLSSMPTAPRYGGFVLMTLTAVMTRCAWASRGLPARPWASNVAQQPSDVGEPPPHPGGAGGVHGRGRRVRGALARAAQRRGAPVDTRGAGVGRRCQRCEPNGTTAIPCGPSDADRFWSAQDSLTRQGWPDGS